MALFQLLIVLEYIKQMALPVSEVIGGLKACVGDDKWLVISSFKKTVQEAELKWIDSKMKDYFKIPLHIFQF